VDYAREALVDAEWVAGHLGDDSVRIVEVDESIDTYAEAHIPGAVGLEWRRDLQDDRTRDVLHGREFGRLMGGLGISNEHAVILYGDRDNWFAAYAYWCFHYYGHRPVRLLDGARRKWIADDWPTVTEVPSYPAAAFEAGAPTEAIRARRDEVLASLRGRGALVDVRTTREFSGEWLTMPGYEHEGPQRAGHIPGAVSVPWAQVLADDGTFRPADELHRLYADAGVLDRDEPTVVYCLLGGRSAHTWFVLHELLGIDEVANYDGGWAEWGSLVGVPVERYDHER
jgi:thiosulfate/3-mercaptopyruvate sulfurtransferase